MDLREAWTELVDSAVGSLGTRAGVRIHHCQLLLDSERSVTDYRDTIRAETAQRRTAAKTSGLLQMTKVGHQLGKVTIKMEKLSRGWRHSYFTEQYEKGSYCFLQNPVCLHISVHRGEMCKL